MPAVTHGSRSFPAISLPSLGGGSPIEVTLLAQLGIGAGDQLIKDTGQRQAAHPGFIDALDEPSARLGGMHLDQDDASSLYCFNVGSNGHPFHRHAGPRVFTAISGSGGLQLRFSTASDAQLVEDSMAFVRSLRRVDIPADSLFTVRFGAGTWHQFVSRHRDHPALFALSCHTNELAGALSDDARARVQANTADIPTLTETLPPDVQALLERTDMTSTPLVALALHASPGSWAARLCGFARQLGGRVRRLGLRARRLHGFISRALGEHHITQGAVPHDSLLSDALGAALDHQDCATLTLPASALPQRTAPQVLASVLEGFVLNPPATVGRLMRLRNRLVAPWQLRTSPLGCPVSSLLSEDRSQLFAQRFPVLAQAVSDDARRAEVLLGADDRHLRFRSAVRVQSNHDGTVAISLATQVRTLNHFGRVYMASISLVHRWYIAPALLRMAVAHAMAPELTRSLQTHGAAHALAAQR